MSNKRFINKKNAVTFQLGHRSQHDPLVADESAPQRVLIPVSKQNEKAQPQQEGSQKYEVVFDKDYDYLQKLAENSNSDAESEKITEENHDPSSSGVQHQSFYKISLPSSVFESSVQEKVGLLNKAAPTSGLNLKLDPEIIAALDDDFDFDDPDNQLEDNFMELANERVEGNGDSDEEMFSDEADDLFDEDPCPFAKEETKSRFTEYSISSSVMKRNEQLTMLDDKFEQLYADYDENVLGPLDCEEIEGHIGIDSERLEQMGQKYIEERNEVGNIAELMKNRMSLKREHKEIDDWDLEQRNKVTLCSNENKWDCESILSVYSNTENWPKVIDERKNHNTIKINARTGIPKDSTPQLRKEFVENLDSSETKTTFAKPKVLTRPKNETAEERKQRKQAIKEERKERRVERKINILAFKEEGKKQKQILLNKSQNIQGNRIL